MKKTLLAMGLGLFATASVAQVTFPVKMGFENADKTEDYHCKFANKVKVSEFGDWVNPQDVDNWQEQSTEAALNGDYGFLVANDAEKKNPWDRGFKLGNLPIKDGHSYRMSFWLKGEVGKVMKAYISKGVEQLDKSFVNPAGQAVYGLNADQDYEIPTDEWHHVSFVAFNHGAKPYNDVLAGTSWMGGAIVGECVPEVLWEAAGINESNKDKSYRDFFNNEIPEIYFAIINAYDGGTFMIDDILIEEDKYFNQATFNGDIIKLDFGYKTNIAAIAQANKRGYEKLDVKQFKVMKNGAELAIASAEAQADGFIYLFLNDGNAEGATVSFTPAEDTPFEYAADKRPSNSSEAMKIFGFENEVTYEDTNIGAEAHIAELAELVSSVPEDASFDLNGNISEIVLKFDIAVDPGASVISLNDADGNVIIPELEVVAGEDENTLIAKTDGKKLTDGNYVLEFEVANEVGDATFDKISFNVGKYIYDPEGAGAEELFYSNFASDNNNSFPLHGLMVKNSDGSPQTPGEGRGSGPRVFNDAPVPMLYLRDWDDGFYYEVGTREDERMTLAAGNNKITFKYAMWKDGNMNLNVEVFPIDEDGTAGENIYSETFTEKLNVNGDKAAFANAPEAEIKISVEEEGNYGIRFKGAGEYLVGDVVVTSVPNLGGIESKTALWNAVSTAYDFYYTYGDESDRYDVAEFETLGEVVKKYQDPADWTNTMKMTTPTEYNAAIEEINTALKNAQDFKSFVDAYDELRVEDGTIAQTLAKYAETKYANIASYKNLKATYDTYKDQALTDLEELKNATNSLKNNAYLLKIMAGEKVKPTLETIADWATPGKVGIPALTARIEMAVAANAAMGVDETDAEEVKVLEMAANALTDNDDIVNALKKITTAKYYKAMQNEETAKAFFEAKYSDYDEEEETGGDLISDGTYNLSYFLTNPNVYVLSKNDSQSGNLNITNIGTEEEPVNIYSGDACPGWTVSEGSGSWSIGWGDLAWQNLNIEDKQIPAEAMFSNWGGAYTVSQSIEDLPAGLYVFKAGINERDAFVDDSYFFWQTSGDEERVTMLVPKTGQNWWTSNVSSARRDAELDADGNEVTVEGEEPTADAAPIEILDGKLTIGAHAGGNSHIFMNNFAIYLVGGNKTAQSEEFLTGLEKVNSNSLKNVVVYDINGRQVVRATKGVNIVKRTYSDGSVKVGKVLVK